MRAPPRLDTAPPRYVLAFLTDQWEWEREFVARKLELAKAAAQQALEALVRDERPELACVTLIEDGVKIGVWDWVESQSHWTRL